jgi:hypothetical protein
VVVVGIVLNALLAAVAVTAVSVAIAAVVLREQHCLQLVGVREQ